MEGWVGRIRMEYEGFIGSCKWSEEDNIYHGKIENIKGDLVSCEGKTPILLYYDFVDAVKDYKNYCQEIEKEIPFK